MDEHIIYIAALLVFAAMRAGRVYGLENWRRFAADSHGYTSGGVKNK